jgi:hypothetical protein
VSAQPLQHFSPPRSSSADFGESYSAVPAPLFALIAALSIRLPTAKQRTLRPSIPTARVSQGLRKSSQSVNDHAAAARSASSNQVRGRPRYCAVMLRYPSPAGLLSPRTLLNQKYSEIGVKSWGPSHDYVGGHPTLDTLQASFREQQGNCTGRSSVGGAPTRRRVRGL